MKKNKIVLGTVLLLFFTVSIETIILIFTYNMRKEMVDNDNILDSSVTLLTISYVKNNKLVLDKINNNTKDEVQFSISNNSDKSVYGYYNINLEIINSLIEENKDTFTYDLTCDSVGGNIINEVLPNVKAGRVPITTGVVATGTIFKSNTHNCKIEVYVSDSIFNKEYYKDKNFNANVVVKSVGGKR